MPFTDDEADFLVRAGHDPEALLDPDGQAEARANLVEHQAAGHPLVSWMLLPNSELEGQSPAAWLAAGRDRTVVDWLLESLDRR